MALLPYEIKTHANFKYANYKFGLTLGMLTFDALLSVIVKHCTCGGHSFAIDTLNTVEISVSFIFSLSFS